MIKKVIIICITFFALNGVSPLFATAEKIKWYSYKEGVAQGKKDGKKIFLHFYADWCHFCGEMKKRTFKDKAVSEYLNKNFIPILVNTDKDRKITANYFVRGLPASFFLTTEGYKIQLPVENERKITNIPGYISKDMFLMLMTFVHTESYNITTFKQYSGKK